MLCGHGGGIRGVTGRQLNRYIFAAATYRRCGQAHRLRRRQSRQGGMTGCAGPRLPQLTAACPAGRRMPGAMPRLSRPTALLCGTKASKRQTNQRERSAERTAPNSVRPWVKVRKARITGVAQSGLSDFLACVLLASQHFYFSSSPRLLH